MRKVDMQKTEIQETEIQETEIQETEMQETEIQKTKIQEAEIQEADMQRAEIQKTDKQETDTQRTDIKRTNIPITDMGKTDNQQTNSMRRLMQLFMNTLYISAFTFGGGFVIVTIMKRKFVDELHWIDEKEMLDFTALAQSSPGAIAVNAAILVGWRVAGIWGMIVAVIGTILPPMAILTVVSLCYTAVIDNRYVAMVLKGMQAGVAAVVLDVACNLCGKVRRDGSLLHTLIIVLAFFAAFFLDMNVVFIILGAAILGICNTLLRNRREGGR